MTKYQKFYGFLWLIGLLQTTICLAQKATVLSTDKLKNYVIYFNTVDQEEAVKNYVSNDQSFDWLAKNVPLFDCPDSVLQTVYYYRWWAFRKHLKETPEGYVFTEFITSMKHAGKYNAISSALGHHIYEGRWLRDPQYVNDYISFWLYIDPKHVAQRFHGFSSWVDDAVYNRYLVNLDKPFIQKNLPALDADYRKWQEEKQLPSGLFWQFDVKDAMEESISGSRKEKNRRPTINSYMYGNAKALAAMAELVKNDTLQRRYEKLAVDLKKLTLDSLWNATNHFFEVKHPNGTFANVREAIGFIPWYFNLPDDTPEYARQWAQLTDTTGFKAPWGITTAERRHPGFRKHGSGHSCEWDGAVWPFATTQTLKGLANLLTNYKNQGGMTKAVFYDELLKYSRSHTMNGKIYLGEYQDEKTGEWLKGDNPRSKFYNHSGFADLIISDLVGLKPRADNIVDIQPLIPENKWDWFCLDNVLYHGKNLTILYDKTGKHYGKGQGFIVFSDGKPVFKGKTLSSVTFRL